MVRLLRDSVQGFVKPWRLYFGLLIMFAVGINLPVVGQTASASFLPDSSLVSPLDTFEIDIVVNENVVGIHCFKLGLDFDESLVTLIDVTEGALLPTGGLTFFFWNSLRSPMEIGNCILGNGLSVDGPGVLATLKFVAGPQIGTCPLELPYLAISDIALDSMAVEPVNGIVFIENPAVRFSPDSSLVFPLDTFEIDIVVDERVAGIHCFKLGLDFDESLVSLIDVTEGTLLPTGGSTFFFWDSLRSPMEIGNCILGNSLSVDGPGVLATLKFVAGSQSGLCPLELPDLVISDVALDSMAVRPVNGVVVIGIGQPPVITSTPVLTAKPGVLYYYDVDASGNPTPVYSLLSGPIGMIIDTVYGDLLWIPTTPGSAHIEVAAYNAVGYDYQSFDVTISCCGAYTNGYTGNTNCSTDGQRNLADITRLIDRVYITKLVLCCEANGNVDGDEEANLNLADITRLIDKVYISKNETEICE